MPADFVPLAVPAHRAADPGGFRVRVLPPPGDSPAPAFAPLHCHPPAAAAAETAAPASTPAPVTPPQVTLRRDGDRVTGVRVVCGCGQVLDLELVY
ncbi:MAG: hypothetical protein KF833_19575 [Verrucomicrobiae bacterium]|nr:hypothetical protein [Verrucomicrobiae bacterium]